MRGRARVSVRLLSSGSVIVSGFGPPSSWGLLLAVASADTNDAGTKISVATGFGSAVVSLSPVISAASLSLRESSKSACKGSLAAFASPGSLAIQPRICLRSSPNKSSIKFNWNAAKFSFRTCAKPASVKVKPWADHIERLPVGSSTISILTTLTSSPANSTAYLGWPLRSIPTWVLASNLVPGASPSRFLASSRVGTGFRCIP